VFGELGDVHKERVNTKGARPKMHLDTHWPYMIPEYGPPSEYSAQVLGQFHLIVQGRILIMMTYLIHNFMC
jgi:hypothetical protein